MKLIYGIKDKPKFSALVAFALQQMLAIIAGTAAVPNIVGQGLSPSAALFGAGASTIVYLLFTKFKSPVFLGSSFAFIGSMMAAFGGAVSMSAGYLGLIIGATFACIVYVIFAIAAKIVGTGWIGKLLPPVVMGSAVMIIGLSLSANAVSMLTTSLATTNPNLSMLCGIFSLLVTVLCSVRGGKKLSAFPFVIGISSGYIFALVFTLVGKCTGNPSLMMIDFGIYADMQWVPDFTFVTAFGGEYDFGQFGGIGGYIATLAAAYIPVACVTFAEHIADHKNLSSIIETDLLTDPGLHRTLLGDGVGSLAGALLGGCPNTTYGESIGCVAITGNASTVTILATAILSTVCSFVAPFAAFLLSIPSCIIGGICFSLYGFIAVSGFNMIKKVNLDEHKNVFIIGSMLITGVGGLTVTFGTLSLTPVACSLIIGVAANLILNIKKDR